MSISTKEQLKSHIHKIHNLIRNSGAGYGLDALKLFNFFYGLKILEPHWEQFELKSKKFSELVKLCKKSLNDESNPKILDALFNKNTGCLYEINNKKDLRNIFITKINEGLKTNFYKQLILEINKIPTINDKKNTDIINEKFDVDIKGKTYEYFIGRDKNAISDLGAYFTDRHITKFILNITKPKLIDNKIPKYIDPFGGSGGFTLSFINYIKNNYSTLEWKKNIEFIRHYDMSDVVVKSCALEILAITNEIPNMEDNFQIGNSFKQNFGGHKYLNIYSNPPFGGNDSISSGSESSKLINELKKRYYIKVEDNNKKDSYKWTEDWAESQYEEIRKTQKEEIKELEEQQVNIQNCNDRFKNFCLEYDKVIDKELIKFEHVSERKDKAKMFKIYDRCNDKESCSLIMFMELLEKNGTCSVVLKEGVLFDAKYSAIRKCLIDKFNVEQIISIPQDSFENTSTNTSIIIFKNNGQTKKIKFSELVIEKELEDKFEEINKDGEIRLELISHKDQVASVKNEMKTTATYEELSKPTLKSLAKSKSKEIWNYSLNYKDYLKDETFCPEGYKLIKLGDKYKINPNDEITKLDTYNYVEISDINDNLITNKTLLEKIKIPSGTKRNPNKDDILLCSVRPNRNKMVLLNKFYNDLLISGAIYNIRSKDNDSNYNHYLFYYLITFLITKVKLMSNGSTYPRISPSIIENLQIPIPNDINTLKPQLKKLSKLHNKISDLTEQIPQKEKEICELIRDLTENGEEGVDWDEYRLGDVCELRDGYDFYRDEMDSIKKFRDGINLPIIKNNNNKLSDYVVINKKYDKYIAIKDDILISTAGTCGRIIKLKFDKGYHAHHMLKFINIKINKDYLYYFMLLNFDNDFIKNNTNGSVLGHLKMEKILNTKIKILKDNIMTKHKLQDKFDEVDKLKEDLEITKNTYKEEINLLMEPFKLDEDDDNTSIKTTYTENLEIQDELEEELKEEILSKPKSFKNNIEIISDIENDSVIQKKSKKSKKNKIKKELLSDNKNNTESDDESLNNKTLKYSNEFDLETESKKIIKKSKKNKSKVKITSEK